MDQEIFDTTRSFSDLGLAKGLLEGLEQAGFSHPTHIQSQLIPLALAGRCCLGQARTGTGKTAAFALPAMQILKKGEAFSGLVLVPVRELAVQVHSHFEMLGRVSGLRCVAVFGGEPIQKQADRLSHRPEVVVGTPGRIMDMHQRGLLPYEHVRLAILDEVDRMLDIGFRDDIRRILGSMRQRPQTIFVSATISPEVETLARTYMKDPAKITTVAASLTVSQVDQSYCVVEPWDKRKMLLHLLKSHKPEMTVIFCRTKRTVDIVAEFLCKHNIDAHAIHGDMYQRKRDKVMTHLREGSLGVLVASDLAARGLDVDDITHVINYDIPEDPEVYIHRIGRTARAGRRGTAWTLLCPDQGELMTNVESLANVEIRRFAPEGFEPGTVPSDVRAERDLTQQRRESIGETRSRDATVSTAIDATDATRFPGGIVPIAAPPKRMGGRLTTRRR
ncbi:MAG: DEAD/DEAH box helicase [Planctomycetota bacterium]|nr:DEAD/DEAH box helicase [Planctomycetota bacterium]